MSGSEWVGRSVAKGTDRECPSKCLSLADTPRLTDKPRTSIPRSTLQYTPNDLHGSRLGQEHGHARSMYYGRVSAGNAQTASSLFQTSQNRQVDLPCLAELNRPMPL
jgi:hypothetical protein